jgi:hypothetical protein
MDKRDTLTLMNAGMILMVGLLGLGTCALLYLAHEQFREEAGAKIERLEGEVKVLRENAERTRQQFLGRDGGVTEF